jgi:hypothetical protein
VAREQQHNFSDKEGWYLVCLRNGRRDWRGKRYTKSAPTRLLLWTQATILSQRAAIMLVLEHEETHSHDQRHSVESTHESNRYRWI